MNIIDTIFRVIGIILCMAVVLMNAGIIVLFLFLPAPLYFKVVTAVLMVTIGAVVATNVPRLYKSLKKK